VRYGNVVGSRGSVVPIFKAQALSGKLSITDERMTRFWITLDAAVEFVLSSMGLVQGGETFVPKIPSMRIVDLARGLAPDAELEIVGIRPGEKLHEVLLTEDEARQSYDLGDRYAIMPSREKALAPPPNGVPLEDGFHYSSDNNEEWLDTEALLAMTSSVSPARRAEDRRDIGDGLEVVS
jgi:UDP-N-acetylglucosamine 4,6-dehydratase